MFGLPVHTASALAVPGAHRGDRRSPLPDDGPVPTVTVTVTATVTVPATATATHTCTAPRGSVDYRRLQWFTPARVCEITSSKAARSSALPTKSISEASTMSSGPSL